MSWIIDHIPLWAYVASAIVVSGAVFYFFSPILIPLWGLTPKWVKILGGGILTILGAYLGGRYKGAQNERERTQEADKEAIQRRQEVNKDVAKVPDSDLDKQLGGWLRRD